MSSVVKNPLKAALRKQIKGVLLTLSHEDKKQQSDAITKKVTQTKGVNPSDVQPNELMNIQHYRNLLLFLQSHVCVHRYWIPMHSNNQHV